MDAHQLTNPSLRLLLVEDNKHDVIAFKRSLRDSQLPHEITHFPRAEPALERLISDSAAFDLLVCDYNLPGMTGFELCKALIGQDVALPMILLTGSGKETLAVDAIKIGVSDYIVKDPNRGYLSLLPVVLPEVVRKHHDRLARQRMETLLAQRERYLGALVKVQQQLLALDGNQDFYAGILEPLGQAANASRVYVFENHQTNEGVLCASPIAAWHDDTVAAPQTSPLDQAFVYDEILPRWPQLLAHSQPIHSVVSELPDDEKMLLEIRGVLAILILPLFVNNQLFGFIGFDKCTDTRLWELSEIGMLNAAAAGISLWQERRQTELKLFDYTDQLQAHNAELDAFAHTVAHDLKNPLSALTGMAEILAEDFASNKDLSHHLLSMVRSGRKASNIVEELLTLASVRQQDDIELQPLVMDYIIAETQDRLEHLIKEVGAEFMLPTVWPVAFGHAPWIEEIWANYISNAIKYGGTPPKMELGATELPNGQVRFWIRDNGQGLTPEQQSQLFTPFTQLKQARAKGHGLGLSIVRRIAEKLGGEVGVESEVGQGSTFYFTLLSNSS